MLNAPLCNLTVSFAKCDVWAIPNWPLSTLTTGKVAIPAATETDSSIIPVGVLEKPTSRTLTNSSFIFKNSPALIEPIPLNTNCDNPKPTVLLCVNPSNTPNVWVIDVKVIGCWTTPSNPIRVLVNCFFIVNLCAFPLPNEPLNPVNVTAIPDEMYSGLVYNSNLFSSNTFAKTVLGRISVTIPDIFAVAPIETPVAAMPINVDSGV